MPAPVVTRASESTNFDPATLRRMATLLTHPTDTELQAGLRDAAGTIETLEGHVLDLLSALRNVDHRSGLKAGEKLRLDEAASYFERTPASR